MARQRLTARTLANKKMGRDVNAKSAVTLTPSRDFYATRFEVTRADTRCCRQVGAGGVKPWRSNFCCIAPRSTFWVHFCLDGELFDNRPPFGGIGLLHGGKCLGRLAFARKNSHSDLGKARLQRPIGQHLHGRRIEPVDDASWRALWRKKPIPSRQQNRR